MAYFECIIGSGGSGTDIPLTVVCSSGFAGGTITCTDGTTTLTGTCPSSSPYTLVFQLPNTGTWTVSGDVSGTTYTKSVTVNSYDVDLKNYITKTVTVYSAASDTVSYTGLDGATHTITTNSSGSATASITIKSTGSTFTFTSSVAKNPSNLSSNYTKSISITSSTSSIYVMPTGVLYWWGYETGLEVLSTSNGWTPISSGYSFVAPTNSTNYWATASSANKQSGYGSSSAKSFRYFNVIAMPTNYYGSSNMALGCAVSNSKTLVTSAIVASEKYDTSNSSLNTLSKVTVDTGSTSSRYLYSNSTNTQSAKVYAMWTE